MAGDTKTYSCLKQCVKSSTCHIGHEHLANSIEDGSPILPGLARRLASRAPVRCPGSGVLILMSSRKQSSKDWRHHQGGKKTGGGFEPRITPERELSSLQEKKRRPARRQVLALVRKGRPAYHKKSLGRQCPSMYVLRSWTSCRSCRAQAPQGALGCCNFLEIQWTFDDGVGTSQRQPLGSLVVVRCPPFSPSKNLSRWPRPLFAGDCRQRNMETWEWMMQWKMWICPCLWSSQSGGRRSARARGGPPPRQTDRGALVRAGRSMEPALRKRKLQKRTNATWKSGLGRQSRSSRRCARSERLTPALLRLAAASTQPPGALYLYA